MYCLLNYSKELYLEDIKDARFIFKNKILLKAEAFYEYTYLVIVEYKKEMRQNHKHSNYSLKIQTYPGKVLIYL